MGGGTGTGGYYPRITEIIRGYYYKLYYKFKDYLTKSIIKKEREKESDIKNIIDKK